MVRDDCRVRGEDFTPRSRWASMTTMNATRRRERTFGACAALAPLLAAAIAAQACANRTVESGEVIEEFEETVDLICECDVLSGDYATADECRADWGEIDEVPEPVDDCSRCVRDVVEGTDAGQDYLACAYDSLSRFNECLRESDCDPERLEACGGATFEDCAEEIVRVEAALQERCTDVCETFEAFDCDNGEQIPIEWQCDGEADCEDGSDEVGCVIPPGAPAR
jgi:hypothetical protein